MDDDIEKVIERYDSIAKEMHLTLETIEQIRKDSQSIEEIHMFLLRFGSLDELISHISCIEQRLFYLKEALTTQEAAQYLGMKVSTLYKKTMNNEIPFYSPCSRRLFFRRTELEQWMLQNRHATNEEMQAEASLSGFTNMYAPKRTKKTKGRKEKPQ